MMEKVTIGKKQYWVLFNANAVFEFTELSGLSIDKLVTIQSEGAGLSFSQARLLIWCGLKEAAAEKDKPFTMTVRDVGKLFDPVGVNIKYLNEFMMVFIKSMEVPELGQEDLEEKK